VLTQASGSRHQHEDTVHRDGFFAHMVRDISQLGTDGHPRNSTLDAGEMLKAAIHLLAGRATAVETTKKVMEDFERLMDSGDPQQSVEILKPEVCELHTTGLSTMERAAIVLYSAERRVDLHSMIAHQCPLHVHEQLRKSFQPQSIPQRTINQTQPSRGCESRYACGLQVVQCATVICKERLLDIGTTHSELPSNSGPFQHGHLMC
jgi:hypothetical protein